MRTGVTCRAGDVSGLVVMPQIEAGHAGATDIGLYDVAVLIPCYNEGLTIGGVVKAFQAALPQALVYVYDNNSTDDTVLQAEAAGAIVRHEPRQGKGNVVRRMFADVDADFYVMVDGDGTYEAGVAPDLLRCCLHQQLDMLNAARRAVDRTAYRPGHQLGNWLLNLVVRALFARQFTDMLSGYRVFTRRFVKSFPVVADGFEIETELTVHAIEMYMPAAEVFVPFRERPTGSASKLNTLRDGLRIVKLIVRLLREDRPLPFFGAVAALLGGAALTLFLPVLHEYRATGLVPRLPTLVLSTACGILSCLSFSVGLILGTVTRGRQEAKRLRYLALAAPWAGGRIAKAGGHAADDRGWRMADTPAAFGPVRPGPTGGLRPVSRVCIADVDHVRPAAVAVARTHVRPG